MNDQDRKELKEFQGIIDTRVAGCELNLKEQGKDIQFTALSQEEMREQLEQITTNHFPHILKIVNLEDENSKLFLTLKFIKDRQNLIWKVLAIGLALIAILVRFGG